MNVINSKFVNTKKSASAIAIMKKKMYLSHLLIYRRLQNQAPVQPEYTLQQQLRLKVLIERGIVLQHQTTVFAHGQLETAAAALQH